jgi:hypothetical protein
MRISQELWKRMKAAGRMLKRGEAERLKWAFPPSCGKDKAYASEELISISTTNVSKVRRGLE